mgnify:CR=1 FL=1
MSAWLMRSELTTAPIVVRLLCAAIGPSSASRAARPRRACPGRRQLGVAGRRDRRRTPTGGALPDGRAPTATATGRRTARLTGWRTARRRSAPALAAGAADAPGLTLATAPPTAGAASGPGLPTALGGCRPTAIGSVLISMKPEPVVTAVGLEALLGEDRLDLVGRDVRILEADLPASCRRCSRS